MKILALIPARGGSKGIPKKNIVKFGKYPLLAYSIAVAKQSKFINRVIVTTDDIQISEIALKYGAEVPFLRPGEISKDSSSDLDFFIHALEWLEKNENYMPDLIVHLRPTTPLRNYEIVDKAILKIMDEKDATSLRSAHVFEDSGYKLFKIKNNYCDFFGKEDFNNEEYHGFPRQNLPKTYKPNGYVDIIIPQKVLDTKLLHGIKIFPFLTEKTVDIDTPKNLEDAEKELEKPEYSALIEKIEELLRNQ